MPGLSGAPKVKMRTHLIRKHPHDRATTVKFYNLFRPVKPLANLIADMVASVPELTIRTFSTEGTISTIFPRIREAWESRTVPSAQVGSPPAQPMDARPRINGPQEHT